jgi:hypothetical protein
MNFLVPICREEEKKGTASAQMNLMPYAEKVQRRSGTATTITTILVTQNRLNAQQRIWGKNQSQIPN